MLVSQLKAQKTWIVAFFQ